MKEQANRGRRERALGIARVFLLCCAAFSVLALLTYREAEARMGEMLLGFGDQIARWEGVRTRPGVRTLHVNGAQIQVATVFFEEPLKGVLDRFEAHCDGLGGLEMGAPHGTIPTPTLRYQSDERGLVSCLDMDGRQSLSSLGEKLENFVKSTNVNDVGGLRYAYARQGAKGTSVLLFWTDRELNLKKMFPTEGNAPGVDPRDVPIPTGYRRTISTSEQGEPYSVNVYALPSERAAPLQSHQLRFRDQAARDGWAVSNLGSLSIILRKDGRVLQAHFHEKTRTFALVELR